MPAMQMSSEISDLRARLAPMAINCRIRQPAGIPRSMQNPTIGHAALRRHRCTLPRYAYHLTTTTRQRTCWFRNFDVACEACRCFSDPACRGDATLLAWVLMPDHAHWLVQLGDRDSLATVVARLKSASSRRVSKALGRRGGIWSSAFHDHLVRDDEDLVAIARYIIANPVRAGLVTRAGDYPFWDAIWL